MSDTTLCAKMLHRIFPKLDVSEIRPVEAQKAEKLALHIRGVRFDIFTRTAREIFDVEAQNRRLKDMCKRPRAYHIVIGHDGLNLKTLRDSGNYNKWNNDDYWSLTFTDAHELQTSNDSSLYCSIKSSLKTRMDHSKTFVLIVGDYTKSITKGGCQYCGKTITVIIAGVQEADLLLIIVVI